MNDTYSCPVVLLAGCGKTISASQNINGLQVWDTSRTLPQDAQKGRSARPQRAKGTVALPTGDCPLEPLSDARTPLADFFSILLIGNIHGRHIDSKDCLMRKGIAKQSIENWEGNYISDCCLGLIVVESSSLR